MNENLLIELIGCASQCGRTDLVKELNGLLVELNAPAKKPRAAANKSGYIQLDTETGKEIARFATIKEANAAMGKKPGASCISQACRNFKLGKSNKAYGFAWVYGEDYKG